MGGGGDILGVSVEIWGILGVLMSYKIPRGIRMVVGRALKGFGEVWGDLGGSRGVRGGQGWSKRGLLDPYRALLPPLQEVLYGTRFGSKHHIMVQLSNVYRGGTTGPFSDL